MGLVLVDATHECIDSRGFALLPLMLSLMGAAVRFGAGRRWLLKQLCPPGAPEGYRARLEQRMGDPAQWRLSLCMARAEGAGIGRRLPRSRATVRTCRRFRSTLTAGGVTGPNVKQIQKVHQAWKAMVERAPNAQYSNVPSSGHQMPVEVPDLVVDVITGVLDACSPART